MLKYVLSGVKHLEEIREAGLETPAINQIEVSSPGSGGRRTLQGSGTNRYLTQLHPLCQCQQKKIVDYSKKHNILIEAYTPLIRGQWDVPAITDAAKKVRIQVPYTKFHELTLNSTTRRLLRSSSAGRCNAGACVDALYISLVLMLFVSF